MWRVDGYSVDWILLFIHKSSVYVSVAEWCSRWGIRFMISRLDSCIIALSSMALEQSTHTHKVVWFGIHSNARKLTTWLHPTDMWLTSSVGWLSKCQLWSKHSINVELPLLIYLYKWHVKFLFGYLKISSESDEKIQFLTTCDLCAWVDHELFNVFWNLLCSFTLKQWKLLKYRVVQKIRTFFGTTKRRKRYP